MNILLIISKNDRYGAQRVFLDQVAALHKLGHHLIVVGRGTLGYVSEAVNAIGVEYHGIRLKGIHDILFLIRLVKKNSIDVIHTYLDRADYFGIIVSWLTRKPVVSTMNVRRYHLGYKLTDKVVVVSNKQRDLLIAKGVSPDKIHLIRPGLDVEYFTSPNLEKRELWKQRLSIHQYTIVFCHISSIIPQKSHEVSIDLTAKCKLRGENPLLIICGDPLSGLYYEGLKKKISDSGLGGNVYFTGWTADLPEILSLTHFTILPSYHEAFGMVLLEGMAAGNPIVAREGEGGTELIEEFGVGVIYDPAHGVDDLAFEILNLWRNQKQYNNLSSKCKDLVRKCFSLESFGNRLMKLYGALAS